MLSNRQELEKESGIGCTAFSILFFVTCGLFSFLLYDFVSSKLWVFLSLVGAVLFSAGIYLVIGSSRHIASLWYLGLFFVGLIMIVGGIATLLPAAPDDLLVRSSVGWRILESRALLLDNAIQKENINVARKLTRRGLGDSEPLNNFGRPLIHDCKTSGMVRGLLNGTHLNPDAQDLDGYTLLMNTHDAEIARAILDAGANPNARSKDGRTPLMFSASKSPELIRILLRKGADVHAVDENGDAVASYFGIDDEKIKLLEEYAGELPLLKVSNPLPPSREEWLVINRDPSAKIQRSNIQLDPSPLRSGDVAMVHVQIGNDSDIDRRISVKTRLNRAVLFVDALHAGEIENKKQPQLIQTIKWPLLSLPANSQGKLGLRIVARSDELKAGDATIDVEIRDADGSMQQFNWHQAVQRNELSAATRRVVYWIPILFLIVMIIAFSLIKIRKPSTLSKAKIAASIVAVVCMGFAVLLIWSVIDPLIRFEEATCTILDRRYALETTRTQSSRSRHSSVLYSVPILAVSIDSNGQQLISTGFSGGSTQSDDLRRFPLGAKVRCWVFPDDRSIFTMTRNPGFGFTIVIGILLVIGTACIKFVRN